MRCCTVSVLFLAFLPFLIPHYSSHKPLHCYVSSADLSKSECNVDTVDIAASILPHPPLYCHIPLYIATSPSILPHPPLYCHIPLHIATSPSILPHAPLYCHIPLYIATSHRIHYERTHVTDRSLHYAVSKHSV